MEDWHTPGHTPGQKLPKRICLLRLSALGDCANIVPVIHSLQAARNDVEITWIINRAEAALVAGMPGVELLEFDKKGGRAAIAHLKKRLRARRFDVLLHIHASWRANRVSRFIRADRRVGFDAGRTRDLQRLFVNERVPETGKRHVVDGFLSFAEYLGALPALDWRVPVANADRLYAITLLGDDDRPILFISPCSSHSRRNWLVERYAAVADHAARRHGMRVVLVGGASEEEAAVGRAIQAAASIRIDCLIGKTTLKQLLALFEHGRILVAPDSGPAHMANATDIQTISLHAATDSRRSGNYRCRALCVDRFAQAAARYRKKTPDDLPWGTRIEDDDNVMTLIPVAAVTEQLDRVMAGFIPETE